MGMKQVKVDGVEMWKRGDRDNMKVMIFYDFSRRCNGTLGPPVSTDATF